MRFIACKVIANTHHRYDHELKQESVFLLLSMNSRFCENCHLSQRTMIAMFNSTPPLPLNGCLKVRSCDSVFVCNPSVKTGKWLLSPSSHSPHLHVLLHALSRLLLFKTDGRPMPWVSFLSVPLVVSSHVGRNITSQSAYLVSEETPVPSLLQFAHHRS